MTQLLRVQNFGLSADGFGAGEGQSLERPFGHANPMELMAWAGAPASWPNRTDPGGSRGLDDYFTRDFGNNIGAEIMGAGMFGCAAGSEPADVAAEEIIGGVAANSPSLDAIGSLGLVDPYGTVQPFCTATLVGRETILTARHCAEIFETSEYAPTDNESWSPSGRARTSRRAGWRWRARPRSWKPMRRAGAGCACARAGRPRTWAGACGA